MKRILLSVAALVMLCLSSLAQADVFNLGTGLTNLETALVGDAGNAGDSRYGGYGSVGYAYNIGKYEVTAGQYCDFLNHKAKSDPYGLYSIYMDTAWSAYGCNIKRTGVSGAYSYSVGLDWANKPVNRVSYWDGCRFANWVNNGQGDGNTETGAYTLNGYNGSDGRTIQRNAGAKWFLPSENEWYKAAYYKGGGLNSGYWEFATRSNTDPNHHVLSVDPGNSANYMVDYGWSVGPPYYRTNVGEFENSASYYGTFDQNGNVWEWNDALTYEGMRGLRGGCFEMPLDNLRASTRPAVGASMENYEYGFRIAGSVPEPSSLLALSIGGLGLLASWRRRRN